MRLTEAGLVYKWAEEEVNKASHNSTPSGVGSGSTAIKLQHLQAAFFILLLGFAISATVLGVEIMAISWWKRRIKTANTEGVVILDQDQL
ncbi:uncharacterized protein [Panulirus ornatus]|uniref:uncharacterized protein n=1 Tax=Panulirus ornatus TaxID=150431 RepID=UPI003A8C30CF